MPPSKQAHDRQSDQRKDSKSPQGGHVSIQVARSIGHGSHTPAINRAMTETLIFVLGALGHDVSLGEMERQPSAIHELATTGD